jgi:lipoprotein-anchoring transpeptidase ErfK/SrfK
VPAIDLTKLDPNMFRTQVDDPTGERPGTIVVNTSERHLYLVQEGGQAIRYGVGIGREGFAWQGKAKVGRKAEWPIWTPPKEMQVRQPETQQYANGMPPGLTNPLGARAMYIYQDGRDTLYRLHGTLEVWSIGQAVSSGCVRLLFHDIIDLYQRCPVGTPIVVNS